MRQRSDSLARCREAIRLPEIIHKAPETMDARTRVRRTFEFEKTDRVTIGYEANAGIHARLCAALGAKDGEELLCALGVD